MKQICQYKIVKKIKVKISATQDAFHQMFNQACIPKAQSIDIINNLNGYN